MRRLRQHAAPLAEARAYLRRARRRAALPGCDAVLLRVVTAPDRHWLDLRGLAVLQVTGRATSTVGVTGTRPQRRFVLHDHRKPRPHFDLRLEEDGVLRSWAVPRGLPVDPARNRLAVAVDDHDIEHLTYTDADKSIADHGTWEEHDRNDRRLAVHPARRARVAAVRPDPHRQRLAAAPHQGAAVA